MGWDLGIDQTSKPGRLAQPPISVGCLYIFFYIFFYIFSIQWLLRIAENSLWSEVNGPLVTAMMEGSWVLLSHAEQVRLESTYTASDPVLGLKQFSL